MFKAFFFALREEILLFLETKNLGKRIPEGAIRHGTLTFFRLSCRSNISFKCPEFETARQRAEYISPSWSH
jgi:hypothetical protein